MKNVNINRFIEKFLDIFDNDWEENPHYPDALNMVLDSIEHLQDREDPSRRGYMLRQARRKKKLSQKDVARFVGVSQASINGYEHGTVENIRRDIRKELNRLLEVDI